MEFPTYTILGFLGSNFVLLYLSQFLDMSSLQASLPNAQLQSSFLGGVSQAWLAQNTVSGMSYPAAAEGKFFSASEATFCSFSLCS